MIQLIGEPRKISFLLFASMFPVSETARCDPKLETRNSELEPPKA
jgi:hypothetical protein